MNQYTLPLIDRGSGETRGISILRNSLAEHWPEYLMEAAELGLFMLSACVFTVLLAHPASPVVKTIPDPFLRRLLTGLAMGLTAIVLIYSPWGQRSGAHLNPAITLTFLRLGKVKSADAGFYVLAQFAGGTLAVWAAARAIGHWLADPPVRYAATVPGNFGTAAAFLAEGAISFLLMLVVLTLSNRRPWARRTGLFAGLLVAIYITLESPISGMSMNPARSLASALPARLLDSLWIYFTAPPLGMLLAAEAYLRWKGPSAVLCAKLHHENRMRCIFRCGYSRD